jgi:hypothetical protein
MKPSEIEKINEASYDKALTIRAQIRDKEHELQHLSFDADLPSEDSIMDYPSKYTTKLQKVLDKLTAIEKAIEEYNKISIY